MKDSFYYYNILSHELHFNFIIQETNSKYFYYQAIETTGYYVEPTAYFKITNEKGEKFFDDKTWGLSGYIKIEPYIKYYLEITLYKKDRTDDKIFMLNFTNYGSNILLEEGEKVERNILYVQHIKYFKDISNLTTNDTMNFKFKILKSNYHCESFYIKYYDSNDFTKLEKSFPNKSEEFDNKIGYLKEGGTFKYELKKKYNSQKGVLFSVFIEKYDSYWAIKPTTIYVSVNDNSEDDEEKKSTDKNSDSDKTDNIAEISVSVVVGIVVLGTIFFAVIHVRRKNSSDSSAQYALIRID